MIGTDTPPQGKDTPRIFHIRSRSIPYAGIIRIRFNGYNLRHPLARCASGNHPGIEIALGFLKRGSEQFLAIILENANRRIKPSRLWSVCLWPCNSAVPAFGSTALSPWSLKMQQSFPINAGNFSIYGIYLAWNSF